MRKPVLLVKHVTRRALPLVEHILIEKKICYEVVNLDFGEVFPDPEGYCAVIVLGGPDSANDQSAENLAMLERIREVLRLEIPYLGICLGMQKLVKAAGGEVVKSEIKEVGLRDYEGCLFEVELTETGRSDVLFNGVEERFSVFQLHGETVVLHDGIELLGKGKWCGNQIVKAGAKAYGIQCHFELTPEMLNLWLEDQEDLLKMNREHVKNEFCEMHPEYEKNGRRLFENFLRIAGVEIEEAAK